jgi:lysyl-tRNA synthetase, class II
MANIEEIKQIRLEKIDKLKKLEINPYPNSVEHTHTIKQVLVEFDELSNSEAEIILVGRILSWRGQGALIFCDLFDGTSTKFQLILKQDENIKYLKSQEKVSDAFSFFKEIADQGDFIEAKGKLIVSKRGEKSLVVSEWRIIAKSIRPLPDAWYGLKDEDERYRHRYIDILLNQEIRNRIEQKSIFWNTFRSFLLERGYIEVETPAIETMPGGADARPFITHHNALDLEVYMRISCGELWQKRLLVAGLPKVFEIGRIFRNEGMSNEHLQDYTQIEFYQAFSDYKKGMEIVKDLYRLVAEKTFGTTKFNINGNEIDLNNEWQTYDYVGILNEKTGLKVLECEVSDLVSKIKDLKIEIKEGEELNRERATDLLWKKFRKEFIGPGFLINVPVFLEPLAKKNELDPRIVDRFQVIIGGTELGKGFSELNDPIDQDSRFEHQEKLRQEGDDEAQRKDNDYVEALEYGMPPAFGFGTSERMFAILSGVSVREAQIFPLMRPKERE